MNILISSASFLFSDTEGTGEGIVSYEIITRLFKRGYKITIFAPHSKIADETIKKITIDFKIDLFPAVSELREAVGWNYFAYKSLEKARQIVKSGEFDVVHHLGPCFEGIYSLMPLIGKPFVYGPIPLEHRGIDFKSEFVRNYKPLTSRERSIVHSLGDLGKKQYRKTLFSADKIIVQLPSVIQSLPSQIRNNCEVIPLGVDTKQFCPKGDFKPKEEVILSVGHMTAIKGFDYLIKAMPHVLKHRQQTKLFLIGDGPDKKYFESLVARLDLKNSVNFLGAIPHNNIGRYFQQCNIYCQPSLSETFGIARLEAMACGKPIVYTQTGAGISGFTSNAKYGGAVTPRKSKELAMEILKFLESPILCKESGNVNRQIASKYYDWENIVDKYENIYQKLWEK